MTTSHVEAESVEPSLPAEKRHLRLSPDAQVSPTQAGRFAVPLDLCEGSAKRTPLLLIVTAEEAVGIHTQLGELLTGEQGDGDAA
ncbi:hypothetical protein ACWGH2_42175 [Streptomyces sp. NPDC054871]